jgi:hypothetical protein
VKPLLFLVALLAAAPAWAQLQMPDPSLIHGRALPAPELPTGTVTVRVVRESIGNDAPGQTVRVAIGGTTVSATTDAMGRAEFKDLAVGQQGRATTTVDGEALESQPFNVPESGGLRVILVAGIAAAAERRAAEAAKAAAAPPSKGVVVFGGNSRVLMQFDNDSLQIYYVLEIVNNARTRVDVGAPLVVELPPGASQPTALEGSSKAGTLNGTRLTITGPFDAGTTPVQIAFRQTYPNSTWTLEQRWPAAFEQITVGVEKVGTLTMASPQLPTTTDVTSDSGTVFVLGRGPALAAGEPMRVTLTNLPFESRTPRYVALGLAAALLALGGWMAFAGGSRDTSRRTLTNRREALLQELEQLDAKRRDGSISAERHAARRQRVLQELESVYGELDQNTTGPQGGGEGVAA